MSVTSIEKKSANYQVPMMVSPAGTVYTVETITPSKAGEMLACNSRNRRLRKGIVTRYARDMRAGNWGENGSAISFDKDGVLLNGQHRLAAVIESNRTIIALVLRGLPAIAQDTMDDLAKRSLTDTFNFHGVGNASAAASITRRVLMWQSNYRTNSGKFAPTKAECLKALRDDPTLVLAIEAASKMSKRNLVSPSIAGLTWWLFWNIDRELCADFWMRLHTGANLTTDSPIYVVREQILATKGRVERVPESAFLAWIIQAWNQERSGKKLSGTYRFKYMSSANFPEPI